MANTRSFFMFCSGDFSSKLRIPIAFANEYPEFLRQASVQLKTESGRRSWDVKIKKMSDKWFIADGWSEFKTDNNLVELNLLTFRISGDSALDVSIFRNDSCLEEPQYSSTDDDDDDDDESSAKTWRFVKKIKDNNLKAQRLDIPKSFVMGTGITTSSSVELENAGGERWPVKVSDRGVGMYNFTRGWINFAKDNSIQTGSFQLFEFVKNRSNKVIKVIALEKEAGEKLCAQAKKGGLLLTKY